MSLHAQHANSCDCKGQQRTSLGVNSKVSKLFGTLFCGGDTQGLFFIVVKVARVSATSRLGDEGGFHLNKSSTPFQIIIKMLEREFFFFFFLSNHYNITYFTDIRITD
jgi:hypothetical protein